MTRTRSHLVFSRGQRSARPAQGGVFHLPVRPPEGHPALEPQAQGIALLPHQRAQIDNTKFTESIGAVERAIRAIQAHTNPSFVEPTFPLVRNDAGDLPHVINIVYGSCPTPEDTARALKEMADRASARAAPPVDAELEAERVRLVGKRVRRIKLLPDDFDLEVGPVTNVYRNVLAQLCFIDATRAIGSGWVADRFEPIPEEPRTIHDAKVGDRVVHINSGNLMGTVEELDAAWRAIVVCFDDGSHGTFFEWDFCELFRLAPPGGGA